MAFGQYILEMEVRVTEALHNTVDCRCSSKTLEPSPCPPIGKSQLKFSNLNCIVQTKQTIWNSTAWQKITEI